VRLKTDLRTADIPVIVITAFDPKADIVKRAIAVLNVQLQQELIRVYINQHIF
jgi:CheY-like chemotaxis protein